MDVIRDFFMSYGASIINVIFMAALTFIGALIEKKTKERSNDKTKREVVETCVKAVEQMYPNLKGEEKFDKAVEAVSEILAIKGIEAGSFELKYMIEAVVAEFNFVFHDTISNDEKYVL